MGRFRETMTRFLAGRYGPDTLGNVLIGIYFALFIFNLFIGKWILTLLELLVLVVWFWRVLSRNIGARMRENEWMLARIARVRQWMRLQKNRWHDRKTHVYRTCPHCKAVVRLPKTRRGNHACDCPRCRREFSVKI